MLYNLRAEAMLCTFQAYKKKDTLISLLIRWALEDRVWAKRCGWKKYLYCSDVVGIYWYTWYQLSVDPGVITESQSPYTSNGKCKWPEHSVRHLEGEKLED